MVRQWTLTISVLLFAAIGAGSIWQPVILWSLVIVGPLTALAWYDALQPRHTILRNFPLIGRLRFFFEMVRPEIQQYFIESNIDSFPIEREYRNIVYQRAKGELESQAFGTHRDVYRIGYEWAGHSLNPVAPLTEEPRIQIGGPDCSQPYSSSLLNISAMSFGALSKNAILALNRGAFRGGFAHNTGEGGISPYHMEPGGNLIWQIGTGYFGCRTSEGNFDPQRFADQATLPNVKMIELKLSQGAKPSHGGVLPGCKVTPEIAGIRGVPVGETIFSPAGHRGLDTPLKLLDFLARLRKLSGGKPVGFKLCIGRRTDFFAICKAMLQTGILPDYITVDGGEGGTGAAPLEFSNSVGMPARDAWIFVHSTLCGVGLRDRIRVVASGKIITGFHMTRALALGADVCASARGMMFALGCIQALRCNTDHCPTGVATQNPALVYGLNVTEKSQRVTRFHAATIQGFLELLGALGRHHPDDLRPHDIFQRTDNLHARHFGELYDFFEPGQLLKEDGVPTQLKSDWEAARPDSWSS